MVPFRTIEAGASGTQCVDTVALARALGGDLSRLPFSLRVVFENVARGIAAGIADEAALRALAGWSPEAEPTVVPTRVSRVLLPDSSGLPALMDLAALRDALVRDGHEAGAVQPQVPVDLVIDHSVTVDFARRADALSLNMAREFERNEERYRFFKWAQGAFDGLRIVPPGMGIVHQVHLERLARVVARETLAGVGEVAFPEFILGGDSHTPMVNALGVLGWGVGGVEIEAAMLGEPYLLQVPRVVGVRLSGTLREGATPTDLVLGVTQRLREVGVVGAFVEFTGPALADLSVPDRATIANMAPEYGATVGFFPIDATTLDYLRQTGRTPEHVALVEAAARATGLFREADAAEPDFSATVEIDLGAIEASLAGPRRPQDRLVLSAVGPAFREALTRPVVEGGFGVAPEAADRSVAIQAEESGRVETLRHGSIVIAAITACTNTSNPSVMLGAGLIARKAVEAGLTVPGWVKTSLAPGSRVVSRYLADTGLLEALETLGFFVVGYGCTTCSGKSGPLPEAVSKAIAAHDLVAAAVLSGNRNFEGRIHRQTRANYIGSPMLVVAYALAGRIDIDFEHEPLGRTPAGRAVFLRDLWPSSKEIGAVLAASRDPALYEANYATLHEGTALWRDLDAPGGLRFPWSPESTYLLEPPFFRDRDAGGLPDAIRGARVLGVFGDSLTTDHISPAGEIPAEGLAGRYLIERGVPPERFNAYTMRRGNHHVMARGTFANIRIRNRLLGGREGGFTRLWPEGRETTVFEAAEAYRAAGTPVIVLGGRDYGMGSSRDWAAKGPALLGVRAVIAKSFERIHRANLIALGILPLRFRDGEGWEELGLTGAESYDLAGLSEALASGAPVAVTATRPDGKTVGFAVAADIVSPLEADRIARGGMFAAVYDKAVADARRGERRAG